MASNEGDKEIIEVVHVPYGVRFAINLLLWVQGGQFAILAFLAITLLQMNGDVNYMSKQVSKIDIIQGNVVSLDKRLIMVENDSRKNH